MYRESLRLLDAAGRPRNAAGLLALEGLIVILDVIVIRVGFLAFPFGPRASFGLAVKLGACLMLGSALPLLPGGLGVHQAACYIALVPAGTDAAGALAFSLVAQVTTLMLIGALGLASAWCSGRT
jgi:uncharacterized membrane protein YbhN (UPF0104 family)